MPTRTRRQNAILPSRSLSHLSPSSQSNPTHRRPSLLPSLATASCAAAPYSLPTAPPPSAPAPPVPHQIDPPALTLTGPWRRGRFVRRRACSYARGSVELAGPCLAHGRGLLSGCNAVRLLDASDGGAGRLLHRRWGRAAHVDSPTGDDVDHRWPYPARSARRPPPEALTAPGGVDGFSEQYARPPVQHLFLLCQGHRPERGAAGNGEGSSAASPLPSLPGDGGEFKAP